MSTIPNSAIPHAVEHNDAEIDKLEGGVAEQAKKVADRAKKIAGDVGERIRDTPHKVAIAAGAAAVVGGVVAAVVASRKSEPAKPARKRSPGTSKSKSGTSS